MENANEVLNKAVAKKGGVRAVARALNTSTQCIYNYLNEKRPPSEEFLKMIGVERIVLYRAIRNGR